MDDKDLPSIEEEFAELDAELKRIASLPVETPEQKNALLIALQGLRDDWAAKRRPDAPPWRLTVDAAVGKALDGLIADLGRSSQQAQVSFDAALLQSHLRPIFDALGEGLKQNLVQKFGQRPKPGEAPPKVDGADVAAMLFTLFGPTKKK
jgi:hypothetical protein